MQLAADTWIAGAYYVDVDEYGQLRVVGPGNHLHFGSVEPAHGALMVQEVSGDGASVRIRGVINRSEAVWRNPAMGHIRKVRIYTDRMDEPAMPFEEVARTQPAELAPHSVEVERQPDGATWVQYRRNYGDQWYGATVVFGSDVEVMQDDSSLRLRSPSGQIPLEIEASGSETPSVPVENVLVQGKMRTDRLGADDRPVIERLMKRAAVEIEHLVKSNKTSGFDYGTIFPRDWMESAELGDGDLDPRVIWYMYHKSLEFISPEGMGWHENVVGEFRYEREKEMKVLEAELAEVASERGQAVTNLQSTIRQMEDWQITRHMIDIEPRYLLGLDRVDHALLGEADIDRLRRTARFVLTQARDHLVMTFKRLPHPRHKGEEDYYGAGNWRDSERGFKMVHSVIAPYDVNAVLYPAALQVIARYHRLLEAPEEEALELGDKWRRLKELFRFINADGTPGYALALYNVRAGDGDIQYQRLEVNHLDEAYDFYYGEPDEAQAVSFCRRLLNLDYFYTPSGPTLVGRHDGYSTLEYHGRVTWTKQTALVVAGLERALAQPWVQAWQASTRELVQEAMMKTARASIDAFAKLGAFPELHYDLGGVPHFYNDQPQAEGLMNKVQLWSAVGARRIIRTYLASI